MGWWANLVNTLAERAQVFVIKLLVVIGAYVVGSMLGTLVAAALNRWVFRGKLPEVGRQLSQVICGLLLAILAALLVMGEGGSGLFGGGRGGGGPDPDATGTASPSSDATPSPKIPSVIPPPPETPKVPAVTTVRVTVLAGAAVREPDRFYQLDDSPQHLTLQEVKAEISRRAAEIAKGAATANQPLTVLIVFPADPNIAPPFGDPKVVLLADWARQEAGLQVMFPPRR